MGTILAAPCAREIFIRLMISHLLIFGYTFMVELHLFSVMSAEILHLAMELSL